MNEISTVRSIEVIAAEINHIKQETRAMVLNNSIEIGRRLVEAKSLVPHGEWSNWLKESVDYSQRTAQNLMKVFDEYGANQINIFGDAKTKAFADLSYTKALALLAVPENEREKFVEENKVDEMSTRELQQAIKDKENAEKEKEEAIKLAEDLKKQANIIEQEKAKLEADIRIKEESMKLNKESIDKLQDTLQREREHSKTEMDKLKRSIKDTKEKLKEAKKMGNSEEVEQLRDELNKKQTEEASYIKKVEELEQQLKEKPVDVAVQTVEKVPEEITHELEQLRKKVSIGDMTSKFKVEFNLIVKTFESIFATVDNMQDEIKEKYKEALKALIGKMEEKL